MKVYICSSIHYDYDDYKKLLADYPCLKDYGFVVEDSSKTKCSLIRDENGEWMRQPYQVPIKKAYIFIYSLEELVKLEEACAYPLIFSKDDINDYTIEIYDGYRE